MPEDMNPKRKRSTGLGSAVLWALGRGGTVGFVFVAFVVIAEAIDT
tara:strand:- start:78 stop:215 length:138 start_codon:yes stop_codon:yes gene_type:complete